MPMKTILKRCLSRLRAGIRPRVWARLRIGVRGSAFSPHMRWVQRMFSRFVRRWPNGATHPEAMISLSAERLMTFLVRNPLVNLWDARKETPSPAAREDATRPACYMVQVPGPTVLRTEVQHFISTHTVRAYAGELPRAQGPGSRVLLSIPPRAATIREIRSSGWKESLMFQHKVLRSDTVAAMALAPSLLRPVPRTLLQCDAEMPWRPRTLAFSPTLMSAWASPARSLAQRPPSAAPQVAEAAQESGARRRSLSTSVSRAHRRIEESVPPSPRTHIRAPAPATPSERNTSEGRPMVASRKSGRAELQPQSVSSPARPEFPFDVVRMTDEILKQLDRRMIGARERMGKI